MYAQHSMYIQYLEHSLLKLHLIGFLDFPNEQNIQ